MGRPLRPCRRRTLHAPCRLAVLPRPCRRVFADASLGRLAPEHCSGAGVCRRSGILLACGFIPRAQEETWSTAACHCVVPDTKQGWCVAAGACCGGCCFATLAFDGAGASSLSQGTGPAAGDGCTAERCDGGIAQRCLCELVRYSSVGSAPVLHADPGPMGRCALAAQLHQDLAIGGWAQGGRLPISGERALPISDGCGQAGEHH